MKARRLLLALVVFAAPHHVQAQAANDNPTGPAGIFNGNVTSGCSYDPYTANATRSITDIVVSGSVGTQPLALIRTANSRNPGPYHGLFGQPGGWQHNYTWSVSSGERSTRANFQPTSYPVIFPDGRIETFYKNTNTNVTDSYFRAGKGLRERFIPINPASGNMLGILILADGSKVEFKATPQSYRDKPCDNCATVTYYYYSYVAQAITDAYGLRTNFAYNADGTLHQVTDASGRYLQFFYTTIGNVVIDYVQASDGRIVNYTYNRQSFPPSSQVYTCLTGVNYYGDSQLNAYYSYQGPNVPDAYFNGTAYNGVPLLKTCDDPMYPGPMRRIGYSYATAKNPDGTAPVYGQILSENYYDGSNIGSAVSTLAINTASTRTETRGDGPARSFTYTGNQLTSCTDFNNKPASQAYDPNGYVNAVTDRNTHTTNYTLKPLTGMPTQVQFPATPSDAPSSARGTISYTYGGDAGCSDTNNADTNNPYYVCTATDEAGNVTRYSRGPNKRITRIDYPDGGYETFGYNGFGQVTNHRMTTGGTESFTYDGRGMKTQDRDPYHASGNPIAWYQYDSLDRLLGVTDTLGSGPGDVNHTTSYSYNTRGQVTTTTHPVDPIDGTRHFVTNAYDISTGTLTSVTDELNHVTSYTYDDYRRVRSVTSPGHDTPVTTRFFYDPSATGDDYRLTAPAVTYVQRSTAYDRSFYDANLRKVWIAVAQATADAAMTGYGYDNVGNVTSVVAPNEQSGQQFAGRSSTTTYDERNRPYQVNDALGNTSTLKYDAYGRKASITRANGQVVTFDSYDLMNRLLQQTVKQTPDPDAVTKYTYYNAGGLLRSMQDPKLVAIGSADSYFYNYDLMGRKTQLTYPHDSQNVQRTEIWHYNAANELDTFTNRDGKVQTINYDSLYRVTGFSWNDGLTPSVTFGYDVAGRTTNITNANATITRAYYNDNLLSWEQTRYADAVNRTVSYTYNDEGRRETVDYPYGAYSFTYTYTKRGQLDTILSGGGSQLVNYNYDVNGNLKKRILDNSTNSVYGYDAVDRALSISHTFASGSTAPTTRTLAYAYDSVGNRKWAKRDGSLGDAFGYDLADQVTFTKLNTTSPGGVVTSSPNIIYDANGNRTSFNAYGTNDAYTANQLNQYTDRTSATTSPIYDTKGDMTRGLDGSTYTYDAQCRVLTATKAGTTYRFTYDGLNRQVTRKIGGASPIYNVYDGWDLIGEYDAHATVPITAYVYGAGGIVKGMSASSSWYYYADASGSTSHVARSDGTLEEWMRYDLQGAPIFYNSAGQQISSSPYGVRHLFSGQQWYSEIGLYDLRNRFYSPDIGRFLQPDPIDFDGDAANLYRHCANNPLINVDPFGLWTIQLGLSLSGQIGPLAGSIGFGIVFDGHGNVGGYGTGFTGATGLGAAVSGGGGGMYSNADTIYGIEGPFVEGSLTAGDEGTVSVVGFGSTDGKVVGYGLFGGAGGGAGAAVGVSNTSVHGFFNIFGANNVPTQALSPNQGSTGQATPPPGGTTYVDPNICPECATAERVIVTGTPVEGEGAPSPRSSLFTPRYAPYAPSLYNFTGPGISSLSNPWGSWGEPHGFQLPGSPGSFYSGLDPVPGSITIGMGASAFEPAYPAKLQ